MDAWMPIEDWWRCAQLERPGMVFEIRNAEGQSLFTHCVQPAPAAPFDWKVPAIEFRMVPETPPQHSDPLPAPR